MRETLSEDQTNTVNTAEFLKRLKLCLKHYKENLKQVIRYNNNNIIIIL